MAGSKGAPKRCGNPRKQRKHQTYMDERKQISSHVRKINSHINRCEHKIRQLSKKPESSVRFRIEALTAEIALARTAKEQWDLKWANSKSKSRGA